MSQYTLYQAYKKQRRVSGSSDPWEDVVPLTLSYNGDGTMTPVVVAYDSTDCGYTPPIEPMYKWVDLDPSVDWICDEEPSVIERWVDGYICDDCVVKKYLNVTSGGTTYSAECDSNTTITSGDVTNRTEITSTTIGSCITAIGNSAYSGASSLYVVRIPSTVTSIGSNAFNGCVQLYDSPIPSSVVSIGDYAFNGCIQLSAINLPNSITSLGVGALMGCKNFSSINIPTQISGIPDSCFEQCDGLRDIKIPSNITNIGNRAFYDCAGLNYVIMDSQTPPTLGTDVFYGSQDYLKIYVPSVALNTYKAASGWSSYSRKIYPY